MIRVVLLGRTGNHLFQYALGRVLSARHRVPLMLDASWFNRAGWDQVSHFLRLPIEARVVRRCHLGARLLRRMTGRHYWEFRGVPVLREPPANQSFDPGFLEAPADCVISGYFQSYRYFESISSELRAELRGLIAAAVRPATALAARLQAANAVAVHVRRGDYLDHEVFRVCGTEYFQSAIANLRETLDHPAFFVFSDDPAWCRDHLAAPDVAVVDSGMAGLDPLHDLHLMSLAPHHIICNSTYSWWAAWLGEGPGQQVILPDRWYSSAIHAPIEDRRLPHWRTLVP